jgi:hypothetical protein
MDLRAYNRSEAQEASVSQLSPSRMCSSGRFFIRPSEAKPDSSDVMARVRKSVQQNAAGGPKRV